MAIAYFEWKRLLSNAFSVNDPWYSVRNHTVSSVLVFTWSRPLAIAPPWALPRERAPRPSALPPPLLLLLSPSSPRAPTSPPRRVALVPLVVACCCARCPPRAVLLVVLVAVLLVCLCNVGTFFPAAIY
jgi:hypothetical protein